MAYSYNKQLFSSRETQASPISLAYCNAKALQTLANLAKPNLQLFADWYSFGKGGQQAKRSLEAYAEQCLGFSLAPHNMYLKSILPTMTAKHKACYLDRQWQGIIYACGFVTVCDNAKLDKQQGLESLVDCILKAISSINIPSNSPVSEALLDAMPNALLMLLQKPDLARTVLANRISLAKEATETYE